MASKSNGIDASEWARAPPPSGPIWRRIAKVIYNSEEKSFLGRTPKRWGIVFTFYLVFYAVLAILFALCMGGLFWSLDENRPTYILDQSLIGANPGVSHRPRAAVVRYKIDNATEYEDYTEQLKEFLAPYEGSSWYSAKNECVSYDNYGFPDTPCFFVKLNKIFDWIPDYHHDTDKLPADMPQDLVEHITNLPPSQRKQVWITCWEENSNVTNIEYPWGRGLPARFYPYQNQAGYRSPLLAVKLTPPVNALAIVRCRAWAKNIIYNKSVKEASGYTRIQLYIEDNTSNNITIYT